MTERASVRVNVDGTLIVPPFECAWLTGDGYELRSGSGCVLFEAKGETDVTLIFRPTPGTKRLQPLQRSPQPSPAPYRQPLQRAQPAAAGQQDARATPSSTSGLVGDAEPNYTVILGSHRNSCLKIEKNGTTVRQVSGVPGARVSSREFQPFWVNYHEGVMTVGTGEPCEENISQQWVDHDPITHLTHIGFSCWDRHVSYRNIQVQPGMRFGIVGRCSAQQGEASGVGGGSGAPLSLFRICSQTVVSSLGSPGVSALEAARVAEVLLPSTRTLYRACLDYLARHFKEVTTSRSISAEPYASPYTHRHASTHLPHANTQQEPGLGPEQDSSEHSGAVGAVAAVAACEPPMRSFSAPAAQHGAMAAAGGQCTSQTALSQAARKDSEPHNGLHPAHSAGSAGSGGSGDGGGSGRCSMDVQGVWDAEFAHLPTSILCDLLLENTIPVTEKQIFDAVVWWATGGDVTLQQQQGQGAAVLDATVLDLLPGAVDVASAQDMGADMSGQEEAPTPVCAARSSGEVCAVLSLIRYTLMTQEELAQVAAHPLVCGHPALLRLVEEAREMDGLTSTTPTGTGQAGATGRPAGNGLFAVENRRLLHLSAPHEQNRAHHTRFQRRLLPSSHECAYMCDGDQNGVLHFIGTLYGTQPWVNPVLARRVDIKASSPPGRHTDPKALASDHFLRTNWAGPRYVNGAADTWWQLDLGTNHQLIVTYYTLRHDSSNDFIRSWALQGSQDGVGWVDLRRHHKDTTLKRPGQYVSWPVMGPAAQTPYRYFRLLLTGPTASLDRPNYFPLSHWELYGYLQRLDLPATAS